ncbi:MAG TPA: hypothetical protein VGH87_03100 [Polyangiaceae bacterium]
MKKLFDAVIFGLGASAGARVEKAFFDEAPEEKPETPSERSNREKREKTERERAAKAAKKARAREAREVDRELEALKKRLKK